MERKNGFYLTLENCVWCLFPSIWFFLIFYQLGHFQLWDDEANTAIFALNFYNFADTYALYFDNILAYNNGKELDHLLRNRYIPPLSTFVLAPFLGLSGKITPFFARLPFALFGLLGLLLIWYRLLNLSQASDKTKTNTNTNTNTDTDTDTDNQKLVTISLWQIGMLGIVLTTNITMILYFRQARYYSLVIFFTILFLDIYCFYRESLFKNYLLGFVSSLLFVTQYYCGVGLIVCYFIDRLLFQRKNCYTFKDFFSFLIPHILISLPILLIWSTKKSVTNHLDFKTTNLYIMSFSTLKTYVYSIVRDFHSAHFLSFPLLSAGFVISIFKRDFYLKRALAFIVVYSLLVTFLSVPSHFSNNQFLNIRYYLPLLPVSFFLLFRVCLHLSFNKKWPAIAFVSFFCISDVTYYFSPELKKKQNQFPILQSTFLSYLQELKNPYVDTLQKIVNWLEGNAKSGDGVVILPEFKMYPLMASLPELHYYWQLTDNNWILDNDISGLSNFNNLPQWNFKNLLTPPKWIIVYDFRKREFDFLQHDLFFKKQFYKIHTVLQTSSSYMDSQRPEMNFHQFRDQTTQSPQDQVLIYERVD